MQLFVVKFCKTRSEIYNGRNSKSPSSCSLVVVEGQHVGARDITGVMARGVRGPRRARLATAVVGTPPSPLLGELLRERLPSHCNFRRDFHLRSA